MCVDHIYSWQLAAGVALQRAAALNWLDLWSTKYNPFNNIKLSCPALNWAGVVQHSIGWTEQTDIMWTKGGRVSTGALALTDIFTLSALLSIGAHYVSHKGHKYRIKSTPSRPDIQPGPQNILPKIVRLEFVSHEGGGGRKFVAMFKLICCTMRSVPVSCPPLFITITTLYWSAEF